MSEIKVGMDLKVLADNRNALSLLGASLGAKYFRIEKNAINDTYNQIIENIRNAGNKDLALNRPLCRFSLSGYDIHSLVYKNAGDGTPSVFINEEDKSIDGHRMGVVCPMGQEPFKPADEDVIAKALTTNDKNMIFAQPDAIVDAVNQYNVNELARIDSMISMLNTAKNSITQTIKNNNSRVDEYKKQRAASNNAHVTLSGISVTEIDK